MKEETAIERKELLKRCQRFWNRERTNRPMVGYLFDRRAPLTLLTNSRTETLLQAGDITVEMFLSDCERRYTASQQIGGDAIFVAYPRVGLPWLEAIMGCTIRAESGVGWAEPLEREWQAYSLNSVPWDNGWYESMKEQTMAAIQVSHGRYPVGPPHLRGPGDIAFALLGATEFCYALYDYPQELRSLSQICAEVWTKVVEFQYQLLVPESEGYWNANQPLWTKGTNMVITADVASILSSEMFNEFLLEPMKYIAQNIDYCIMHMHSSYLHILDLLLPIEKLRAVQISIDPNGPSLDELLPLFNKILSSKALIVGGQVSFEDINTIVAELPSEGLCILSTNPALYTDIVGI